MNQLPTLIEYLLLNHDYVVIPGFGTFIVQQMDALRNETEEAFLPPYRSVRFNAGLNQADPLLSDSMQEIFNTSPQEASLMLETWINDLNQALEDNGCAEFGALGVFSMEDDGSVLFTAQESGVTTPEFYGLDTFHFSEVESTGKTRIVPITASMETDEEAITIRINRRIANIFVAACAAVLLFMVFNNPVSEKFSSEQQISTLELLMHRAESKETPKTLDPKQTGTPTASLAPNEVKAENEPITEAVTKTQQEIVPEYCIVMASAISQSNAEKFVSRLKTNGFVSARIITNGKMTRVVVGHYQSEEAAAADARDIRQRAKEFRSAWVHRL